MSRYGLTTVLQAKPPTWPAEGHLHVRHLAGHPG
jgi:hypothetical protein